MLLLLKCPTEPQNFIVLRVCLPVYLAWASDICQVGGSVGNDLEVYCQTLRNFSTECMFYFPSFRMGKKDRLRNGRWRTPGVKTVVIKVTHHSSHMNTLPNSIYGNELEGKRALCSKCAPSEILHHSTCRKRSSNLSVVMFSSKLMSHQISCRMSSTSVSNGLGA